MKRLLRLLGYEVSNIVRSRWLLLTGVILGITVEVLFRIGDDPGKSITSLLNIMLIVIPLFSVVLGTIYAYNSREFNELLLAQPLDRTTLYLGRLFGFTAALCIAFIAGVGIPFLLHIRDLSGYGMRCAMLLAVGVGLIASFSSLGHYAATRFEDRIRGLGTALVSWFFLAIAWDGIILLVVRLFREYPYEPAVLTLVFLNPIDLGRVLVLMQMDIAALMGYTGAIFRQTFEAGAGNILAAAAMVIYAGVPILLGLKTFQRKDF